MMRPILSLPECTWIARRGCVAAQALGFACVDANVKSQQKMGLFVSLLLDFISFTVSL